MSEDAQAPTVDEIKAELARLQQENAKDYERLARSGLAVNPEAIGAMKIAVLIEFVLGDQDSEARLRYELMFSLAFKDVIADGFQQLAKMKGKNLLVPKNGFRGA